MLALNDSEERQTRVHLEPYTPKPSGELYQHKYGYEKPTVLGEWQWNCTFAAWSRNVTFSDGWTGLSYPLQPYGHTQTMKTQETLLNLQNKAYLATAGLPNIEPIMTELATVPKDYLRPELDPIRVQCAAPELLYALEELLKEADAFGKVIPVYSGSEAVKLAREAISKAKGNIERKEAFEFARNAALNLE